MFGFIVKEKQIKILLCAAVLVTSLCFNQDHTNLFGDIPHVETPVTSSVDTSYAANPLVSEYKDETNHCNVFVHATPKTWGDLIAVLVAWPNSNPASNTVNLLINRLEMIEARVLSSDPSNTKEAAIKIFDEQLAFIATTWPQVCNTSSMTGFNRGWYVWYSSNSIDTSRYNTIYAFLYTRYQSNLSAQSNKSWWSWLLHCGH